MTPGEPLEHAYSALRAEVRNFVARRVPPDAVDDLAQEVFLRVHEHAGELRDTARFAPWLFRIARSVVVDHLRRQKKHAPLEAATSRPPRSRRRTSTPRWPARSVR